MSPTPDPRLIPVMREITNAVADIRRAKRRRDKAIRAAFPRDVRETHGFTVDDIARAAELLSKQRVYQIVGEAAAAEAETELTPFQAAQARIREEAARERQAREARELIARGEAMLARTLGEGTS
jgi:multidrug efflux pump subunit AcrA (membrane-fusion protein)